MGVLFNVEVNHKVGNIPPQNHKLDLYHATALDRCCIKITPHLEYEWAGKRIFKNELASY